MKKIFLILVFIFFESTLCFSLEVPYTSYTYTSAGKDVYSPSAFIASDVVYPSSSSSKFSDMFYFDGRLYLLDAGMNVIRSLWDDDIHIPLAADGSPWNFVDASGLFITEQAIYIADKGAGEICIFDKESLRLVGILTQPEDSLYDPSVPFTPSKVIVDNAGNVYALVPDLYRGAVMYSPDGTFVGFFGSNQMELSFSQRLDQNWKRLLNRTQRDAMERFVPVAYSSFDIDAEDFVYTCSFNIEDESKKIRRINPSGNGRWDSKNLVFGDVIPAEEQVPDLVSSSKFIDIDIHDGIVSALDLGRGRIFQYDQEGRLIAVSGGFGSQKGVFINPVVIESDDDHLYVLDASDSSITVFEKTWYGINLFKAVSLYTDGLYLSALPYWNEVLRINPGLEIAYLGKGEALEARGEDSEALSTLRFSGNREQYSLVFGRVRLNWARKYLAYCFAVLFVALIGWLFLRKFHNRNHEMHKASPHLLAIFHPVDTIWEMKRKRQFSIWFSTIVLLLFFFSDVLSYFATGYIFNENPTEEFNLLFSLVGTIGLFLMWTLINWAVSTLSDGKGTIKDIYCASSYALIPLICSRFLIVILSHVLTLDEGSFLTWISLAAIVWSCILLIFIVSTIHQFSFGKTVGNIFLTILGCAFFLFLVFMAVVLFEHTLNIFSIIFNELMLRR